MPFTGTRLHCMYICTHDSLHTSNKALRNCLALCQISKQCHCCGDSAATTENIHVHKSTIHIEIYWLNIHTPSMAIIEVEASVTISLIVICDPRQVSDLLRASLSIFGDLNVTWQCVEFPLSINKNKEKNICTYLSFWYSFGVGFGFHQCLRAEFRWGTQSHIVYLHKVSTPLLTAWKKLHSGGPSNLFPQQEWDMHSGTCNIVVIFHIHTASK